MKKNELIASLNHNYTAFINFINSLSNEIYNYREEGKWSAGLHLAHLILSVKPLVSIYQLDKSSIIEKFGNTTKKGRSYSKMKTYYIQKLKEGGKAPNRFVPNRETAHSPTELSQNLEDFLDQLYNSIERFSEEELDTLCVPHPLLGSLSLREMLYNTIYHAEHHQNLIGKMINEKSIKTN